MSPENFFVPTPDPERAMHPEAEWGRTAFELNYKHADFIVIRWVKAPEGIVILHRCQECGGRKDLLLDARASGEEEMAADIMSLMVQHIKPASDAFVEEHRRCDKHPRQYELPGYVYQMLDAARRNAARRLAEVEDPHVRPHYLFLYGDKHIAFAPVLGMPDYDGPRTAFWATLQGALRDHMRAVGLSPTAALYVSEVWVSSRPVTGRGPVDATDRQEAVSIMALTPTYGRTGTIPITRARPGDESTVGTLGELEWLDGTFESRIADGLFALTDVLPQDDETKLRALGLPMIDLDEFLGEEEAG